MKWTGLRHLRLLVVFSLLLALHGYFPELIGAADWQAISRTACERAGCDGELLIAIGTHEPDQRGNQSLGDGGLSFGRFQMKASTAARYILGTTDTRRMTADQYLKVAALLLDDQMAATLAALELARCSRRNKRVASRLRCWNNSAVYVDQVLAVLKARKVEK